jgi:hypothetical protein
VEKGAQGFTVEKINEIMGFENIQNGVLNFDEVPVPVGNRIGDEGQGWRVMTAGLNFERTMICAQTLGWTREVLRNVVPYAQRRVQFGKPTIDLVNNQFKIADLITQVNIARLLTYHTAYLWDLGQDITLEANMGKVFICEGAIKNALDAIQVMGGDGVTPFYPLAALMNVSKVENISGGSMEACRLVIYRTGLRQMADEFKMPRRVIHEELGVPVPATSLPERQKSIDEESLLKLLSEDYQVNPGLYMSREDIKESFDVEDTMLDELLILLERKGMVKLYPGQENCPIQNTYEGLKKTNPTEYYQWYPPWVKKENVF